MASKNAFLDFKNRYAGEETEQDIKNSATESKMYDQYKSAYNSIINIMNSAKKSESYGTYAKQTEVLKGIAGVMEKMTSGSGSILSYAMKESAAYYTKLGLADLAIVGKEPTKPETWHAEYNEEYVNQMFKDSFAHIAANATSMAATVKSELRKDSARIFQRAAVEGTSKAYAYRQLKAEILGKDPAFKFTDKRGRQWPVESYLGMLTRTVMMTASRESYANTLTNEGQDLVIISMHGAKDECRFWEKRVLSLTGATKGYPTIADAQASGQIFHPRCKHSFVAYHADIEEVFALTKLGATHKTITGGTKKDLLALTDLPKKVKEAVAAEPVVQKSATKTTMPTEPIKKVTKPAAKPATAPNQHVISHLAKVTDEVIAEKMPMSALMNMSSEINKAEKDGKPFTEKQISKMWEDRYLYATPDEIHQVLWKENDFEKTGSQKGSNEGGVYKHKITGQKFYIKVPKTDTHVHNEISAAKLYELAGLKVPKLKSLRLDDGRLAVASAWKDITTLKTYDDKGRIFHGKKIAKGFAVDAWLGNWDAIGTGFDNAGTLNNEAFRIDVGGSMLFRAQGGPKGAAWGYTVNEFKTMIDPDMSPEGSAIFKNMSKADLMESMRLVIDLKKQDIDNILMESGFVGDKKYSLLNTLVKRQTHIKKLYDEMLNKKDAKDKNGIKPYIKPDKEDWSFVTPTAKDIDTFTKWVDDIGSWTEYMADFREKYPDLADHEIMAVCAYTNGCFDRLNRRLRSIKDEIKEGSDDCAFQRILNYALRKVALVTPTPTNKIHRGIDLSDEQIARFSNEWKVGAKRRVMDNWSTSTNGKFDETKNVQLKITLKNKHPYVDDISVNQGEQEVILISGTKLECTGYELKDGVHWYSLKEID